MVRYSVDPGDTGVGLGCVVRLCPGQLARDDIEVNRVDQLDSGLTLGHTDELVSNVVEIRTHNTADVHVRATTCSILPLWLGYK